MEEDDLAAIRARRMAELQGGRSLGGGGGPGNAQAQQQAAQEKQEQMKDMKNSILSQVLSQEARARLNTIMLAKPSKGAQIEASIVRMAQTGQVSGKMSEQDLIGLLEQFSEHIASTKTTVKFDRRRAALDSDSD